MEVHPQQYILLNAQIAGLSFPDILRHAPENFDGYRRGTAELIPIEIGLNHIVFENKQTFADFPNVRLSQTADAIILICPCKMPKRSLCKHMAEVLVQVMDRPDFRIFFDDALRLQRLKAIGEEYGLTEVADLEAFFAIEYAHNRLIIHPKSKALLGFGESHFEQMQVDLLPSRKKSLDTVPQGELTRTILLFRKHKYYHDQFHIELYEAQLGVGGKIKAPFTLLDPNYLIWKAEAVEATKFFAAISKFQSTGGVRNIEANLDVLASIARNPLKFETFWQDSEGSDKLSSTTLEPILLQMMPMDLKLTVTKTEPFFYIHAELQAHNRSYPLADITVKFEYFIQFGKTLNLVPNATMLRVIDFFRKHDHQLILHQSKFGAFRQSILAPLEQSIEIQYPHVPVATKRQLQEQAFDRPQQRILYLSEEGSYIAMTPVMRYGNVEIQVFSRRQIFDIDARGREFRVERDQSEELNFTAILLKQHPDFSEQLHEAEYFYLHKTKFLNEDWFLEAFEDWRNAGITILGFNELKKNKLNMHKGKVSVKVSSDTDWFNIGLKLEYGRQKASLKQIQKSIKNRSKYVQLDDGTLGVLPEDWIEKFSQYFHTGEVFEDLIRSAKSRFAEVHANFETEVMDLETRSELNLYLDRFANFEGIQQVPVPSTLNATLRDYQQEGLNWLNFLDEFNFGGCLADDMGLGKTIQVLAFLLLQQEKRSRNTNLIVVPTSLLFNWQDEVAKFAPSLQIFTHHGNSRLQQLSDLDQYQIILTTYGMLQNDVQFFKKYAFNYIILDESQAIKNPDSLRYKSVRLLQSRNKLVLTGTPFENNSFDIYGQLSFACPGLLGSRDNFKFLYSNPIERFSDHRRAMALSKIIQPFILRRSKQQVAQELPEKTEMVIYCEMGPDQRALYAKQEKELRDYLMGKNDDEVLRDSMHVLTGLTKLRQICNSPALLSKEEILDTPSAKIDVLIEQIVNHAPHHKILVFSQFVGMLDLIKVALEEQEIEYAYLTGQTRKRAAKVEAFQNDPKVRVFLISLKAGGVGLNLTAADYVYIVDPWWNPAVENQAIDRSHRIGQENHVVAVKLICKDTIEEKILLLQAAKTRLSEALIRADGLSLKSLSKEDLLKMLR